MVVLQIVFWFQLFAGISNPTELSFDCFGSDVLPLVVRLGCQLVPRKLVLLELVHLLAYPPKVYHALSFLLRELQVLIGFSTFPI